MHVTDRGLEELRARRGQEEMSFDWLATQLQACVELHPPLDVPIERLASWLARLDDEED